MSVGAAYDALAADYDETLARDPVAQWMRRVLWSHYDRIFSPGARVLDFTAGTGADALYLAMRGVEVVAVDASARMLQVLERGARVRGLSIETITLPAERLSELKHRPFDGALSSFAGLNTIADIPHLAATLSTLMKPHARVLLHALNGNCLWHTLSTLARGEPARAPRLQGVKGAISLHLYNPFALYRDSFSTDFRLCQAYGMSLIAAPGWTKRMGRVAPLLFRADRRLGQLLPDRGDFFVMDLKKR